MTKDRYNRIMDEEEELSKEEFDQGWHFCMSEWDGLLVGPGMEEYKYCKCVNADGSPANQNKP